MTHQKQKEIFSICRRMFGKIKRSINATLPSTEWDDIFAAAAARVFLNFERYDSQRPLGPWVYTVMRRTVQNELRARFAQKHTKTWKWKVKLTRPERIKTVLREIDEFGNEAVVHLPDLAIEQPAVENWRDTELLAEFLPTLKKREQRLVKMALDEKYLSKVCKKIGVSYSEGGTLIKSVRKKWAMYLTDYGKKRLTQRLAVID